MSVLSNSVSILLILLLGSWHPSHSGISADSNILCQPLDTEGIVYSQEYSFALAISASNFSGVEDQWLCDDFILDGDYYLTDMDIWTLWTYDQATHINITISEDDLLDWDPNTNIDVWSESVPCTHVFTGDSNWGYDIYKTHCTVDSDAYPELESGKHYYLEVQADSSSHCYVLFGPNQIGDMCWYDNGDGIWQESQIVFGMEVDMFFVLHGELLSLESETWGSIKILF